MTPEQFAEQINQAVPTGLRSVVLYGSAAAGDHLGERSDYNILMVFDRLGLGELKALVNPTKKWVKQGNHPPLLFTGEALRESADVFPIELLDMRDARRVLLGDDVLKDLAVSDVNLRLQVEHELRGKLLQLQSQFLLTELKASLIVELMTASLSKFLILFRAATRLYRAEVPAVKSEALKRLAEHIQFDQEVFVTVLELKQGRKKAGEVDAAALFERYLRAIETITKAVHEL